MSSASPVRWGVAAIALAIAVATAAPALDAATAAPGVDIAYYGAGRPLECDLVIAPGVDAAGVRVRLSETDRTDSPALRIDAGGGPRSSFDSRAPPLA